MEILKVLRKLKKIILDALYPNDLKCILCGRDIPKPYICSNCLNEPIFNEGNRCIICDTPIEKEGNIICEYCKKNNVTRVFKNLYCPLIYDGKVRRAILQFKSDSAAYLAHPFATLIAQRLVIKKVDFDIIVPVPSHASAKKERGYNPARLLADELGKIMNKPVEDILYKKIKTKKQKFLDYKERQTNLTNSMDLLNKNVIKGKNILIIDDIITTGATIDACAKLLVNAKNVYGAAIARREPKRKDKNKDKSDNNLSKPKDKLASATN